MAGSQSIEKLLRICIRIWDENDVVFDLTVKQIERKGKERAAGRWLTRQAAVAEAVPPASGSGLVGVLLVVGDDGGHPPDGELHLHGGRRLALGRCQSISRVCVCRGRGAQQTTVVRRRRGRGQREGGRGEGWGSGSEATAAGEEEEVGRAPSGRGQRPAAAVRGGAGGDGGGDGARGLHLRSCGAAPGGCNASRDAYNSATPGGEVGRARRGSGRGG